MTYNLTNLTSSNNFLEYSVAVNQLAGGLLFAIFIIIIGMIIFSRLPGKDTQKLVAACFFCFIASSMLVAVGIMTANFAIISFIAMLLALFLNLVAD